MKWEIGWTALEGTPQGGFPQPEGADVARLAAVLSERLAGVCDRRAEDLRMGEGDFELFELEVLREVEEALGLRSER